MRVTLVGMTSIDWPLFLDACKPLRPTQDMDSTNLTYSPAGAWNSACKTAFLRPGMFQLILVIDSDLIGTILECGLPVVGIRGTYSLISADVRQYVESIRLLLTEERTKEQRLLGMEIYKILYQHAREFVKDIVKSGLQDGTWICKN